MSALVLNEEEPFVAQEAPNILLQISQISIYSGVGVAVRIASTSPNSIIPPVVYPQMIGCFLMGLISASKTLSSFPYLRLGLATGLCGSITSFSSFILSTTSFLITGSVWNGLMLIFLVLSSSYASFLAGRSLMEMMPADSTKAGLIDIAGWLNESIQVHVVALGAQFLFILLCIFDASSRQYSLSAILGPFGSLLRFLLAKRYNKDPLVFPVGTFVANIAATVLLSILAALNNSGLNTISCLWIFAISNGFCGSLSTISTFIGEMHILETRLGWRYAGASISAGVMLCLVLLGIPAWVGKSLQSTCSYF